METALLISNGLLWCVLLALVVMVIALARQVGVLFERVAPMGALVTDSGPKVGQPAPSMALRTMDQAGLQLPGAAGTSTLLFFLSPTCPVCKKLLPALKSMQKAEAGWLQMVLASDGDVLEHQAFRSEYGLTGFQYVLSAPLGMAYRVARLPYAVLIDASGVVSAKGLINSREQLESLLTAQELGVASVQEYLDAPAAHQHEHQHAHQH
ncbi:methylamine dehydrogenase accessory protein MauD [Janthinobacterium sp. PC23-8]|uniref:methylamine dehydrogenase accessory protein MauD n=1 Tax=Janthinobacterium sp. PC23-8 TaxID=2012679 RepID=UPI000B97A68B|nr:methylamine dehydrogenase accessory protein MauD [Janthinobacterium sp. PC23-8]OYO27579.1 methylamine dehydrogenase accessory protein MauD [Janthinobacterium sp. PC23-8]